MAVLKRFSTIRDLDSRTDIVCDFKSGSDAVAFLVLFSGPAGAGIVATDLCASSRRLGRFDRGGSGLKLHLLLLAALLAFDFFG